MPHVEPIYSSLATDPVLGEIVEMFVEEMPTRIETLLSQAAASDWEALGRTAHQLKGALGSHGFDQLTATAQQLETAAREDLPTAENILQTLDELVAMCKRLRTGTPESGASGAAGHAGAGAGHAGREPNHPPAGGDGLVARSSW